MFGMSDAPSLIGVESRWPRLPLSCPLQLQFHPCVKDNNVAPKYFHAINQKWLQDADAAGSEHRARCKGTESHDASQANSIAPSKSIQHAAFDGNLFLVVLCQDFPDCLRGRHLACIAGCQIPSQVSSVLLVNPSHRLLNTTRAATETGYCKAC